MRTMILTAVIVATGAALAHAGEPPGPPRLGLPIDCTLGSDCWVQNYVDVDGSKEAGDFTCGGATYDGHGGVDIRVLSLAAARRSVSVLAAAAGLVKRVRDGEPDRLMADGREPAMAGKECGNGVVVQHAGGWQTQYCHLREGSVSVRPGDAVERGDVLGAVGASGMAQFAHVHLTVRQGRRDIDPFTGKAVGEDCGHPTAGGLWLPELAPQLAYKNGEIIQTGFAAGPVDTKAAERGAALAQPRRDTPIVFFSHAINLLEGDRQRLRLIGPAGVLTETELDPLERHKAQYVAYVGKKAPAGGWEPGAYRGVVEIVRDAKLYARREAELILK